MVEVEIINHEEEVLHLFLDDLTDKARKEVLDFLELKNPEEGNLDVVPIATISKPEEI